MVSCGRVHPETECDVYEWDGKEVVVPAWHVVAPVHAILECVGECAVPFACGRLEDHNHAGNPRLVMNKYFTR